MLEEKIFLEENTVFNFECKLCGNCCKNMLIRLTPFDIINLSECLNLATYDFIPEYVLFLKTPNTPWLLAALKHVRKGECMFKKGKWCSVHESRPLPCRLFPVGRKKDDYLLHKTKYCKGHESSKQYTKEKWLEESKALAYVEMSRQFYHLMDRITKNYDLEKLSEKNRKLFYKLLYDYDSASLDGTVKLENNQDKAEFCAHMALWFLEYIKGKEKGEIEEEKFLAAFEQEALKIEEKLRLKRLG